MGSLALVESQMGRDLQAYVDESRALEAERSELLSSMAAFGKSIPAIQRAIYAKRLRELDRQLDVRKRLGAAVEAGHEPYSIPGDFSVGFVDRPTVARLARAGLPTNRAVVFNAPIPFQPMQKYIDARAAGIFDEIVITSSDASLFREVEAIQPPRPTYVDPFLVGFIAVPEFFGSKYHLGRKGAEIAGAQGFLIAHWDLAAEYRS